MGAGAAPQNFLPLRHHPPQPRGRLEGGGEGYCPLRIPAAWRALEDGLLHAGWGGGAAGAAEAVGGVGGDGGEGRGDRVEEHMSYAWLQMLTRAKEEQRQHLGEVGGVVDVDAEEGEGEGEGEGDDASSMRKSRSGGSKGKVGRPRKAPKLPVKSGGQPSTAQPPPAAHVDAWVAAQAGAMPEWQRRVVAAEGEVLLLRGKLSEAEQRAQEAERRATAAERDRDVLRAQARKPKPKPGQ